MVHTTGTLTRIIFWVDDSVSRGKRFSSTSLVDSISVEPDVIFFLTSLGRSLISSQWLWFGSGIICIGLCVNQGCNSVRGVVVLNSVGSGKRIADLYFERLKNYNKKSN